MLTIDWQYCLYPIYRINCCCHTYERYYYGNHIPTVFLGKLLCLIACITVDRMNLPAVTGIHRRQFTGKALDRHVGARKHIARISVAADENLSQRG